MVLLVTYTAWWAPFELGFLQTPAWAYITADHIINLFFASDIILNFFVAYLDMQTHLLVVKHSQIATRYLKTWFMLDVAASIPMQTLGLFRKHDHGLTYSSLNMLRLLRLRRVGPFFAR